MLFWYALGATRRTKFQVVQSIVVLPIIGLKKKLTLHLFSTEGWLAVDIYDWQYMNITSVTSHAVKVYTQDVEACKINSPTNLWAINCLPNFLNSNRFESFSKRRNLACD